MCGLLVSDGTVFINPARYIGMYVMINSSIKDFNSSFYCDNAVSCGQRMATLIRQYSRIHVFTYVCMYVCINNHRSSGFRSNH